MRVIAGIAKGQAIAERGEHAGPAHLRQDEGAIFSMLEAEAFKRGLAEPGYLADVEEGEGGSPWRQGSGPVRRQRRPGD